MQRHAAVLQGMRLAVQQGKMALFHNEVPVGASVVGPDRNGKWKILAAGRNKVEAHHDATLHAEIEALRRASKASGNWRMNERIMCTTVEPCTMCLGAIQNARFSEIIYGAQSPRFGTLEGRLQKVGETLMANHLSYQKHSPLRTTGGVYREQCASLMDDFFKSKRTAAVEPEQDVNIMVQGLVLSKDREHVLLRRHKEGAYTGRYTGLLDRIPGHGCSVPDAKFLWKILKEQSHGFVEEAQCLTQNHLGTLEFYECGESEEEEVNLDKPSLEFQYVVSSSLSSEENPPGDDLFWFRRTEIPFHEMPADDLFWYNEVFRLDDALYQVGRRGVRERERSHLVQHVSGYFVFQGKDLLCHAVELGAGIAVRETTQHPSS